VDTVGLIALWDEDDQWHEPAQRAFEDLRRSLLRTLVFVTVERFLGSDKNAISAQRRSAENFRLEFVRGDHAPVRFVRHHSDHAAFAGEINFPIPGDRRKGVSPHH